MTRVRRILLIVGGSIVGLALLLFVAVIIVVQTSWFRNYVRQKIVTSIEDATGGRTEVGSFSFHWLHLRAVVRNLVIHGTEPADAAPLLRANLVEVDLTPRLPWNGWVGLSYLLVDQPRLNVIVYPNGRNNLPSPKTPSQPSGKSGLKTVVDLAVDKFDVRNGYFALAEEKAKLDATGHNLHAHFDYNSWKPGYKGQIDVQPLDLQYQNNPVVPVTVKLPLALGPNSITVQNAVLETPKSVVHVSGDLGNLSAAVRGTLAVNAQVSIQELQSTLGMKNPLPTANPPGKVDADFKVALGKNGLDIKKGVVKLGESELQISGPLQAPTVAEDASFHLNLALGDLGKYIKLPANPKGDVHVNGNINLGLQGYQLTANVQGQNLAFTANGKRVSGIDVNTHVTAVPDKIELSNLKVEAEGGNLTGHGTLANMKTLQFAGDLHGFRLQKLTELAGMKDSGYSGVVSGPVEISGDIRHPSDLDAKANLQIASARGAIPLSGHVNLNYKGSTGTVNVAPSHLTLPHTTVQVSGSLGKQLQLHAVSHDLKDLKPLLPSLPVNLARNGSATVNATIRGSLKNPQINAHATLNNFNYNGQNYSSFAANINGSPSQLTVSNATLSNGPMQVQLSGTIPLHNWKPATSRAALSLNLNMHDASMQQVLALVGKPNLPITGTANINAHINGSLSDPRGTVQFAVLNGTVEGEPFDRVAGNAVLGAHEILVPAIDMTAGPSHLHATVAYQHPVGDLKRGTLTAQANSNRIQLAQFQQFVKGRPGLSGLLQMNGGFTAQIAPRNGSEHIQVTSVYGNFDVHGLQMQGQNLGDLTARATTVNNAVQYYVASNFSGSTIRVNGQTQLSGNNATTATASIESLPIQRALLVAGRPDMPVSGNLSANAQVSGTLANPHVTGTFTVANGTAYELRFDRLEASLTYANQLIDVPSLRITSGPSTVVLNASYSHPAGSFQSGTVRFEVRSNRIELARFLDTQRTQFSVAGMAEISAAGSAIVRPNGVPLVTALNGQIGAQNLVVNGKPAGGFNLTANTSGQQIAFKLGATVGGGQVNGSGTVLPPSGYYTKASLTFTGLTYSHLQPLLGVSAPGPVDAAVSGGLALAGSLTRPADLNADLKLSAVNIYSVAPPGQPQPRQPFLLRNNGPVLVTLRQGLVNVQNASLFGAGTQFTLAGTARLTAPRTLNLRADGHMQLGVLEAFSPKIFSSGTVTLAAAVNGTVANPLVDGTLKLQNASLHVLNVPTGLSNGNGTIRFNGTEAVIQNINGEVGGGKVVLSGLIGYGGPQMQFRVQATVDRARVEYPADVSTEASARVSLTGSTKRSLVSGNITIFDVALYSHSDLGTMLSSAAAPTPTPTQPTGLLAGMRLDVRIQANPGAELRTTLTQNVQLDADMRLRGTVDQTGMLGRVNVTQGDVIFFGAKYTIDTGVVRFYDPNRIRPVLNVDLTTTVQGINVALRVSGPMEQLKLTYHSDPPLQFSQIVSLLATGKVSTTDPVLAARQPVAPQQSFEQMGASALLGQAVANPVAGRLQRLFGVSKFKINPQLVNGSTVPQATVTLEQQVTPELTFTYIQDLTQSNPQTIRVEWAINPDWSAVAERAYNGAFDVDLLYKKRFW